MSPNTKLVLSGAAFLVLIVGCSVAVARAITNDENNSADTDNGPISSAKIVSRIRNLMNDTNVVNIPIQAYIIPSEDAHQSEYVADRDNRIQYVSKFTGSSGRVVIHEGKAALFTDSRYYTQAENQLDNQTWTLIKEGTPEAVTIEEWLLTEFAGKNSRVGVDPSLMKASEFQSLGEKLQSGGHKLVSIQQNLVDLVWDNRPEPKLKELEILEQRFSGKKAKDKVAEVRAAIKKLNAESHIVSALDDIAWLLNLRGSDIEYNPVFFAYVIITNDELHIYLLNEQRFTDKIYNHFYTEDVDVILKEYNNTLAGINNVIRSTTGKVLLSSASEAIQSIVPNERRVIEQSPIVLMKVIKNEVEALGMRQAHIRDGAAVVKYLHWLETEIDDRNITEIKGAEKLKYFRSQQENYRGLSFPTISAVGSHAAMPHYVATAESDRRITRDEIYLVDSGAQYLDGTTDITRTVHFGTPTKKEIDAFTRVLKGFISVATSIFPPNATLSFFDAMARRALWDVGLDYGHGTGHGVGAYLNVHELPPLISSRNTKEKGMMRNMFTSNEPGYYEEGVFGIRIEDVLHVVDLQNSSHYFDRLGAYKFDDITMVPIQTKLIDIDLLTDSEIKWLNEYHTAVRENVTPLLGSNSNVIDWLNSNTEPIKKQHECNPNVTEPDTVTSPTTEAN